MSLSELLDRARSLRSDAAQNVMDSLTPAQRDIIERLEYELTVVDLMGFNGYFCIVADFIGYAKSEGIPVGPGR